MTKYRVLRAVSGLTLAAVLLLGAGIANAAETTAPAERELLAQLAKEPPLAQSDIEDYIRLLPSLLQLQATMGYNIDPAELERVLKASNVDPDRFHVLLPKVSLATMTIMGIDLGDQLDALPAAIRPSADEVKLVEDNWEKIQQVYIDAQGGEEDEAGARDDGPEKE